MQDAAEREVAEECGLKIKLEEDYFSTKTYSDGEINYVFKASLISGDVVTSQEHTEFKWVSGNDWKNLEYTPDVEATIKEFLK